MKVTTWVIAYIQAKKNNAVAKINNTLSFCLSAKGTLFYLYE